MIWRAEVDTGESKWYTNALRFDTEEEATTYAQDLAMRWTMVKRARVVEDTVPEKEPVDTDDTRIVVSYA